VMLIAAAMRACGECSSVFSLSILVCVRPVASCLRLVNSSATLRRRRSHWQAATPPSRHERTRGWRQDFAPKKRPPTSRACWRPPPLRFGAPEANAHRSSRSCSRFQRGCFKRACHPHTAARCSAARRAVSPALARRWNRTRGCNGAVAAGPWPGPRGRALAPVRNGPSCAHTVRATARAVCAPRLTRPGRVRPPDLPCPAPKRRAGRL
jgi:hypothetical protein